VTQAVDGIAHGACLPVDKAHLMHMSTWSDGQPRRGRRPGIASIRRPQGSDRIVLEARSSVTTPRVTGRQRLFWTT
jgi:hypothetical protein